MLRDLQQLDPTKDQRLFVRRYYCQNLSSLLCSGDPEQGDAELMATVENRLNEAWSCLVRRGYLIQSISNDHYDTYVLSATGQEAASRDAFDNGSSEREFAEFVLLPPL